MKKYVVRYKEDGKVFGVYASPEEASIKVVEYINDSNDDLEGDYVSPFDFVLEEVECWEVNEVITDFESAKKYLVGNTNDVFGVTKKCISKRIDHIKDAEILIKELNPKHIKALVALNRLFTIAEAWNKADGFVPDFSDLEQYKYYPLFVYDKVDAKFKFSKSMSTYVSANFGSRICFKTGERAEQFGKQFIELYKKVFL